MEQGLKRYKVDKCDVLLMLVGTVSAVAVGCSLPITFFFYGRMSDRMVFTAIDRSMSSENTTGNATQLPSVYSQVSQMLLYVYINASCVILLAFLQATCWSLAAERQCLKIRTLLFHSILKQDLTWFDAHQSGELNSILAEDVNSIQNGLGNRMAYFIQYTATCVSGFALAFIQGTKLALIVCPFIPVMVICAGAVGKVVQSFTDKEVKVYAKAGAIAEEALMAIRTVAAFGGEEKAAVRYRHTLQPAKDMGIKKGLVVGIGTGILYSSIFATAAVTYWYGSKAFLGKGYTLGNMMQVVLGVAHGSLHLGQAVSCLEQINMAISAVSTVRDVIASEPLIDSSSEDGLRPEMVNGNVELCDVHFSYPARPDIAVLQGVSIEIKNGQKVALVGPSGCGKSTIVQLIQRFYDPLAGEVKLDSRDIRNLNIRWLRQQIGVVSQEPALFAMTIAENISYGAEDVTEEDILRAAKEANAHDFIVKLPLKYDTLVGERGAQLSGGQKQRIAIARALVRNPKVLVLDEATSALDTESESVVQAALDKASQGRTTLVIAHRLSTVRNADFIIAIENGHLREMGSHNQLLQKKGLYYQLAMNQSHVQEEEKGDVSDVKCTELLDALLASRLFHDHPKASLKSLTIRGRAKVLPAEINEVQEAKREPEPLMRIIKMNASEWPYLLLGSLAATSAGIFFPWIAVFFGKIAGGFAKADLTEVYVSVGPNAGAMAGFGLIFGFFTIAKAYCFSVSGEYLTLRLRDSSFRAMLRQEVGWFDDKRHQVGVLTTMLATDASVVKGAAGSQIGHIIEAVTNVCSTSVISLVLSWKLALAILPFLPFMILTSMLQIQLLAGFSRDDKKHLEEAGKISSEAIDNIRTVASLTKEAAFEERYRAHAKHMFKEGVKRSMIVGLVNGISMSALHFLYAVAFTYGAVLQDQDAIILSNYFGVVSGILFSGFTLGRTIAFSADYGKARVSASRLFALLDRQPQIDSANQCGKKPERCDGLVEFESVRFAYPSRPKVNVLQGLDLKVNPGQSVALVGSSGCGKSTSIQLIENFYQPFEGAVKIDGEATDELNIKWLRSKIGLVSQEPTLFNGSIRENIAYGDNSREVAMNEIITVARSANIHSFIRTLPQGYDTNVGAKGTQLSGGQKQRIAIARALLRNPKILLLDEATSALDTESEKVVQEALDRAQKGRTSIIVAHKLSTVQNADVIAVIHNGQVVEQGSHKELVALRGHYFSLQRVCNGEHTEAA